MARSGSPWSGYALAVLRIVTGFVFTLHGFQKVFGILGGMGGHGSPAPLLSRLWAAGVIESIGGPLIMLGLCTRPVAFVLCGEMAVAYFTGHFPRGFWPIKNGGEPAVLDCFIFLYLWATGPGPLSIDGLRGKA